MKNLTNYIVEKNSIQKETLYYLFPHIDENNNLDNFYEDYLEKLNLTKKECENHPVIFKETKKMKTYILYDMLKVVYIDADGTIYNEFPKDKKIEDLYIYGTSEVVKTNGGAYYKKPKHYSSSGYIDYYYDRFICEIDKLPLLKYDDWRNKHNPANFYGEGWAEVTDIPENIQKAIDIINNKK